MDKRVALVIGATGTIGSAITKALIAANGWRVLATTRRTEPGLPDGVTPLVVDVLDRDALRAALATHSVTHVFYAALFSNPRTRRPREFDEMRRLLGLIGKMYRTLGWIPGLRGQILKAIALNSASQTPGNENERMFENVLAIVEASPHRLQHVGLVTGGKTYGMHLTPYVYPDWRELMREDTPRAPGPNFYYNQEDRLAEGARTCGYSYTISRPPFVIGFADSVSFSVLSSLAVYAALLKEQGRPLIFPGDVAAANNVYNWCDAEQIAALHLWAVEQPRAHNEAFNVDNDDPQPFRTLWPRIADALEMTPEFREQGFKVTAFMREHRHRWPQIVAAHDLQDISYARMTSDDQMAILVMHDWDMRYDLRKLRAAGFTRRVDSAEMFDRWITRLRRWRVIP
ncbi:MAG: NAD-dependent epimerase/dehydratase family protein [Proteobacteria bacterium]|nr:NAD-dependent epimerase/dehydratase family protein [Pseudomonadota bacterium]